MAEYNPSKIIKDGNTYNFRDTTKIPLAGTNALSGSIVPSTDNAYNLGSTNYRFKEGYFGNLWGVGGLRGDLENGIDINYQVGANLILRGKNRPIEAGIFWLVADNGSNSTKMKGTPSGTLTWGSKNVAMAEDVIPRSGGAVMTGIDFGRNADNGEFRLHGGTDYSHGASVVLYGKDGEWGSGRMFLHPSDGTNERALNVEPNGTFTWDGTAIQYVSDQRYKQQINQIDDKLLDAWEDVNLVQFKYNDAVSEKKDNARLHTGYVVQQIDSACKKHDVDISQYGLYCHEEYPEEAEEVEVEQKDGTKTKEKKVIREASEHYSLRYTEALIVECAYLRKCIKELRSEIEELKSNK